MFSSYNLYIPTALVSVLFCSSIPTSFFILLKYVNKMFNKIDLFIANKKSSQAKRQMKQRKLGAISERARPAGDAPDWAVRVQ